MPIYEYKCQLCGHQFEQLQKVSDAPLKICPKCNKHKLKKLVSNTSFQLKGTGWYVTDFKDKKAKTSEKSTTKTEKKTAEKKEVAKKAETKNKTEDKK